MQLSNIPSGVVSLVLILCAGTSCGGGKAVGHRFKEIKEEGVPTAVTYGGPEYEGELFTYEHILTLHQDPTDFRSLLQRPSNFIRGEDGSYFVLDSGRQHIAVYGPDGEFLRYIGGSGAGPGEFRNPLLQGIRGNQLLIFDSLLRRLTRYTTKGELIDTPALPRASGGGLAMHITADGIRVVIRPTTASTLMTNVEVALLTRDGRRYATLRSPEMTQAVEVSVPYRGQQIVDRVELPFSPVPCALFVPGRGILLSFSNEPVLRWHGLNGGLREKIRIDTLNTEITQADRERFRYHWEQRQQMAGEEDRRMIEEVKSASVLPDQKPYWTFIWVDDAGYYWLCVPERLIQFESDEDRSEAWRVLSPEGEYLGITRTPSRQWVNYMHLHLMPISISQGHLMSIATDSTSGEKHLNVYRMVPAAPGFTYP